MSDKEKVKTNIPSQEDKRTFGEKFSLLMRKKWLTNSVSTIIIVIILVCLYLLINIGIEKLDLDEIDVTKNQIYTVSNESKEALKNLNETVTVYVFGFDNSTTDFSLNQENLVRLLKQYANASEYVKYEVLNSEDNLAKIQEYELQTGYDYLIFESATSHKIVSDSDLVSYDYTSNQKVYLVEETITNGIFGVTDDNRPKAYFVTGHGEVPTEGLQTVLAYMENENVDSAAIDLKTTSVIPEDCKVLIMLAPAEDYFESEVAQIKQYINNGGNIMVTSITSLEAMKDLTNFQTILDIYGVTIENNGYVFENDPTKAMANAPFVITPSLASYSKITENISKSGYVYIPYAGRITTQDDEWLENNQLDKVNLAWSSNSSVFITDLTKNVYEVAGESETGSNDVAVMMVKTLKDGAYDDESTRSSAIFIADSIFAADYVVEGVSSYYPMSYIKNNKDLFLNSVEYLAGKTTIVSIRKDMSTSTYAPTQTQNLIVFAVIFSVPVVIIITGVVVGIVRKRKK
jgi:ABC-2 type transport system permease protein